MYIVRQQKTNLPKAIALTLVKYSYKWKKMIYVDHLPSSKSISLLDDNPDNVIFLMIFHFPPDLLHFFAPMIFLEVLDVLNQCQLVFFIMFV